MADETEIRAILREEQAALEGRLKAYIDERIRDAETNLLRAFSDYQGSGTARLRHIKLDLGNLTTATDDRLAALERRVGEIDKRLILNDI
jgi:hypothetical protein